MSDSDSLGHASGLGDGSDSEPADDLRFNAQQALTTDDDVVHTIGALETIEAQPIRVLTFADGPSCQWFLAKQKAWRRDLVRRPWIFPVAALHLAATTIQQCWRPCWLRAAKISVTRNPESTSIRAVEMTPEKKEARCFYVREVLHERYLDLLKRQYDRSNAQSDSEAARLVCYPSHEHFMAATIQCYFRNRKEGHVRALLHVRELKRYSMYHIAAFEIQSAWRVACQRWEVQLLTKELIRRQGTKEVAHARLFAATKIQRYWRKLGNYRIFCALRDIVAKFRGTGDPFLLLRSILPMESMYLDPAMQVHIRFRLGGERFPPSIYFKIFTHGAVCDMGSFAPRNYAAERLGAPRREEDYYVRIENNGWRPLVVRFQPGSKMRNRDEVEKATSKKAIKNFHHSRIRRRQDVERQRKERTRAWMQKLYSMRGEVDDHDKARTLVAVGAPSATGGAARLSRTSPDATRVLAEPRPPSKPPSRRPRPSSRIVVHQNSGNYESCNIADFSDRGQDNPDISDDMLMEWSKHLDFDAYIESWSGIATSDCSEGNLPIGTCAQGFGIETFRAPPHAMIARVH